MDSFYSVGDEVLAYWEQSKAHFIATVAEIDASGKYLVVYADNDTALLDTTSLLPLNLQANSKVLAKWRDGKYYPGTIVNKAGHAYFVQFDDGDKGWIAAAGIAVK